MLYSCSSDLPSHQIIFWSTLGASADYCSFFKLCDFDILPISFVYRIRKTRSLIFCPDIVHCEWNLSSFPTLWPDTVHWERNFSLLTPVALGSVLYWTLIAFFQFIARRLLYLQSYIVRVPFSFIRIHKETKYSRYESKQWQVRSESETVNWQGECVNITWNRKMNYLNFKIINRTAVPHFSPSVPKEYQKAVSEFL
jgi:hypothetical protein